jgi:hypothetical protein
LILLLGLLICLLLVFFQDWKYRRIHVMLPILIFIFCYFLEQSKNNNNIAWRTIALNSAFFLTTLGFLIVYMSIKYKKFLNPFQNYFGFGDLLFYISLTPMFLLHNYILFFILSMVFAISMQMLFKKIIQENSVPLAGFSAIFLMIVIILDCFLVETKITLI